MISGLVANHDETGHAQDILNDPSPGTDCPGPRNRSINSGPRCRFGGLGSDSFGSRFERSDAFGMHELLRHLQDYACQGQMQPNSVSPLGPPGNVVSSQTRRRNTHDPWQRGGYCTSIVCELIIALTGF